MNTKLMLIGLLICMYHFGTAQSCEEKLNQAQRAYYNGNLRLVIASLSDCVANNQLKEEDREDALKLLINSYLILDEDSLADTHMARLLMQFPLTRVRETDLVEFKRLYDSYEIKPNINLGFLFGFNYADFEILQHRSYASFREEPEDYGSVLSPSLGITAEYSVWNNLYVGWSIIYQNHKLSYSEVLLDLQELKVRERMHHLHFPFALKYVAMTKPISFFVSCGINPHLMLSSKADLTLLELDRDFPPPIFGNSRQVENYNLTFQRNRLNFSYTFGLGLKKQIGFTAIEIGTFYDFGLNNLVKIEQRYTDDFLLTRFSYTSDDFKMNHYRAMVGIYRTIFKSNKK